MRAFNRPQRLENVSRRDLWHAPLPMRKALVLPGLDELPSYFEGHRLLRGRNANVIRGRRQANDSPEAAGRILGRSTSFPRLSSRHHPHR